MTQWRVLVPIGVALALWAIIAFKPDVPVGLGQGTALPGPCRPTAAEVAATEIAQAGLPTTTPTPAITHPEVTTELAVLVGDQDVPILLPSLVIRAPLSAQSTINELLRTSLTAYEPEGAATAYEPEGTPVPLSAREQYSAYRQLLIQLLTNQPPDTDKIGLLSTEPTGNAQEIVRKAIGIAEPPLLGVGANGTVTLVIPQKAQVLGDNSEDVAGGWTVDSSRRSIRFLFKGEPDAATAWEVRVCTDGLPIVSARLTTPGPPTPTPTLRSCLASPVATPLANPAASAATPVPTTPTAAVKSATPTLWFQNANTFHWTSPPAAKPTTIEIVTEASPLAAFRIYLFTNFKPALTALSLALPALLLLASTMIVARADTMSPDLERAWSGLRNATVTILRLTFAMLVFLVVFVNFRSYFNPVLLGPVLLDTSCVASPAAATPNAAATPLTSATPGISVAPPTPAVPDPPAAPAIGWAPSPQLDFSNAQVRTGIFWPIVVALGALLIGFEGSSRRGKSAAHRWSDEASLALGAIATIVVSLVYFQIESSAVYGSKIAAMAPAILVAGYTIFLAAAARAWRRSRAIASAQLSLFLPAVGASGLALCVMVNTFTTAWGDNAFLAKLIIPIWVTGCAIAGCVLLAMALIAGILPHPHAKRSAAPKARRTSGHRRTLPWVILGGTALALAVLVQWGWSDYRQETIWWRAAAETDPWGHLAEISKTRLDQPDAGLSTPLEFTKDLALYPIGFLMALLDLLVLVGLIGVLAVLKAAGRPPGGRNRVWPSFWRSHEEWIRWILSGLYAAFVVGYGGEVLGLRAPVALVIGLFVLQWTLSTRIQEVSDDIDASNRKRKGKPPLIVTCRDELLRRAFAVADLGKTSTTNPKPPEGNDSSLGDRAKPDDYVTAMRKLDEKSRAIRQGLAGDGDRLLLEEGDAPEILALALGPAQGWWNNGVQAAQIGGRLALVPIAYFAYIFLISQGAGRWSLDTPFAVIGIISGLAHEVAFWLVAAFVFGCLFPYLRGQNGPVKGAALAAVYIAANAGAALLGIPGNALWQVRSFQVLLFLMLLGFWLDLQTVRAQGLHRRDLLALYDLPNITTLVSQVLPLATALGAVVAQLVLGQTQEATKSLVSGEARNAISLFISNIR